MNIAPSHAIATLVATNFATFAARTPSVFDDSVLTLRRKASLAAAYLTSAAAAGYGVLQEPTTGIARSTVSGALLLGSMGIFFAAAKTTETQKLTWIFSPDAPKHLVKSGPYQFMRHPFYAAYLGTFDTAAVASNHPAPLIALAAMGTMYTMQTNTEETKFAQSKLAQEYADYSQQAGRFWPFPVR